MATKFQLVRSLDDFELLVKELIEVVTSQRANRTQSIKEIVDTMLFLDNNMKQLLEKAEEQVEVHQKVIALQAEINQMDKLTNELQKQLSDAEQLLATVVYQAKQKLESINKADKKPVSFEDLVKLAHRISASNGVCAPLAWKTGDLRRPYPTDKDMKSGLLFRMGDYSGNSSQGVTEFVRNDSAIEAGTYSWFSSTPHIVGGSSNVMQRQEDGESSDSSSSSDSDSP
uniref:uncharacterized protein LOC641496 n=1 Tax=Danio rerio TaxID=7955 RepID=UPI00005E2533|nr:uncharacterized protein LOC641496 [Danio rerio]